MKLISLTNEEAELAREYAEKMSVKGKYQFKHNHLGMLGEIGWGKFTKQKPNLVIYERGIGDDGTDFKDTQVKTVGYNGPGEKEIKVTIGKLSPLVKKLVLMYANINIPNEVYVVGERSRESFLSKAQTGKYERTIHLGEYSLDVRY